MSKMMFGLDIGIIAVAAFAVAVTTAHAADPIGVAACDRYLAEYEACINSKIPEGQRAVHRKTLDERRKGWTEYGNTYPSLKSTLEQTCKNWMTVTNMTLLSYGCSLQ